MPFDETRPQLTREALRVLADVFAKVAGFQVRDDLAFVLERRLAPRLDVLGLRDFVAYARYLKNDPRGRDEVELALDLVMPHETYFFREPVQLQAFTTELVPLLSRKLASSTRLQVWSAGCATGEEAYTIAMLLEASGLFTGWDVDVLGTDLSSKSLAVGRHAEYGQGALRVTTPEQLATFFSPAPKGRYRVADRIRQWVSFGHVNLLEPTQLATVPTADVIFCRNVLMYFDVETRKRVVDVFFERLKSGGYLLLGHSENLFSLSTRFELVHLESDLVYRRP
jgi:chemotaxis protein methyltransferase CheR